VSVAQAEYLRDLLGVNEVVDEDSTSHVDQLTGVRQLTLLS
jgi:hypothetical protein